MKQEIFLENYKNLYDFLVFLLGEYYQDIPKKILKSELDNYKITGICDCISDEKDYLYDNICGSFYLESIVSEKGIFEPDNYSLFRSNIGLFIFHMDSIGHLKECEFFYRPQYYPEFYLEVVNQFTGKQYFDVFKKCLKYNKVEFRNLDYLKNVFTFEDMGILEVE